MADFNSSLGLRVEGDEIVLDTRPEHEVGPGLIHFAVLATLAEVSAAQAVGAPVVPANINLSLLAKAAPGRLHARGRVVKRGGRLSVVEGEVRQGDQLVAKATVTFAMLG
jgi:acyl-coenzyme A thioesterase PaaI-like protein